MTTDRREPLSKEELYEWRRWCEKPSSQPKHNHEIILRLLDQVEALEDNDRTMKYHRLMGLLRSSKLPHGACDPPERKACTACMAQREIETMLGEYRGAPVSIQ